METEGDSKSDKEDNKESKMSNCPRCQIVHGAKLSAMPNCPGANFFYNPEAARLTGFHQPVIKTVWVGGLWRES